MLKLDFIGSYLRLPRPNITCNLPHQPQLILHPLHINQIPPLMTREPTLRTHPHPSQRFLPSLSVPLGDNFRSLINPALHLLLVFEFRELGRHDAEDDRFVLWEEGEGLKSAGTGSVVFEVVGVDVEGLEELGGDSVVGAFAEVAGADKVSCTQMKKYGLG